MRAAAVEVLVITWEEDQYVMRDEQGDVRFKGPNTFHMSRWAFDQGAKKVVHNYKIDCNDIARSAE